MMEEMPRLAAATAEYRSNSSPSTTVAGLLAVRIPVYTYGRRVPLPIVQDSLEGETFDK
jgi:hypothetical protein